MDNANYVESLGDGSFIVVIGGQIKRIVSPDSFVEVEGEPSSIRQAQTEAENTYNQEMSLRVQPLPRPVPQQTYQQPTVVREYNEQTPGGGWQRVQQMSNGAYQTQNIAPSGYGAAGIATLGYVPSGNVVGGGSAFINQAGQWALQAAQQKLVEMRYREIELPQFQHTSEMAKKQLALQVGIQTFGNLMSYGQSIGWLPRNMPTAREIAAQYGLPRGTSGMVGGTPGGIGLEQARRELVSASGGMEYWQTATPEAVSSEYLKLSGKSVGEAEPGNAQEIQGLYGDLLPTLARKAYESTRSNLMSRYPALSAFPSGMTATPEAIPTLEHEVDDLSRRLGALQTAGAGFGNYRPVTYR